MAGLKVVIRPTTWHTEAERTKLLEMLRAQMGVARAKTEAYFCDRCDEEAESHYHVEMSE